MASEAEKVSRELQAIAQGLDGAIEHVAGRRVAWTLVIYTDGQANYISSASREDSVRELRKLLEIWESGEPDVPVHNRN